MKKVNLIFKIGLCLVISFFVVAGLDIFWLKNSHPTISGYFCNIATESLGLFVTLCGIEYILDKFNNKKEKQDELKKINRQHLIISTYLSFYTKYFYCVTTPIGQREADNVDLGNSFKIQDMCDLHSPSLFVTDPLLESAIVLFFKYENKIREIFIQTLSSVDFKYYTRISDIMTEFIEISLSLDVKDTLIFNEKINMGEQKTSDFVSKIIKVDDIEDLYQKYKQGELYSCIQIQYFVLYDLLKKEQEILQSYIKEIDDLKK